MKKFLAVSLALALAGFSANAQDSRTKARVRGSNISAPMRARPHATPNVQLERSPVQGAIPQMIRGDAVSGEENVSTFSDDPGHGPKNQKNVSGGVKLFSFEF